MMIRTITIIGTGNLAWHLAKACKSAGIPVDCIAGRNTDTAASLASEFNITSSSLSDLPTGSDLYVLAVKDDAIAGLAREIYMDGMKMIHTSGAVSSDVLNMNGNAFGALWPMQTLVKGNVVDYSDMLIAITARGEEFTADLKQFAERISSHVVIVSDEQRAVLHLCAVWVNNFTNHLFEIAVNILQEHDLDFKLMLPMIRDMMEKTGTKSPHELQTGPARRGDDSTINKHLELLSNHPDWKEIYHRLSESIRNQFTKQ